MPTTKNNKSAITKDMTMGEILANNPDAADVMLGYGLHCVGCGINDYDTIEQGAMLHGMSEEEMIAMMDDLNNAAALPEIQTQQGISITAQAIRKIKELQLLEEKQGWPLQVEFLTHPDKSKEFFLEFVATPQEGQTVLQFGSVALLFSPEGLSDSQGLTIDYIENDQEEGFHFRSAKETQSATSSAAKAKKKKNKEISQQ